MPSILNATTTSGLVTSADNSGSLQLQTNSGTTAVTIDTSQRVGIGTSAPTNSLSISNSSSYAALSFDWTGDNAAKARIGANHITGEVQYWATTNYFPTFYSNNTERMRITSAGDLLVNTTSKISNGLVSIAFSPAVGEAIACRNTTGTNATYIAFQNSSSSQIGFISGNGSNITYSTSSDYRLKENIAPMTGALNKVLQLKPCTYTWKSTGEAGEGFIAHELQAVVPDAVTGEKDAVDEEGNIKPQGIDTSFLVATLTAALQEAHGLIKDLQARVETLEAK